MRQVAPVEGYVGSAYCIDRDMKPSDVPSQNKSLFSRDTLLIALDLVNLL